MNEQKSWYPTPVQRSMLDFMKEQQPQLYAELSAEGKLQEHLRDYSHWYHDKVDMITEQIQTSKGGRRRWRVTGLI